MKIIDKLALPTLTFIALSNILSFLILVGIRFPLDMSLGPFEDYFANTLDRYSFGKPIYPIASVEYTPFIYGPLYTYLSSAFLAFSPLSFSLMRIVSLVSVALTPIIFYLILRISYSENLTRKKSVILSIIYIGLYLASYPLTEFWIDIAKVDSLLNFWILASFLCYLKLLKITTVHRYKEFIFTLILSLISSQFIFIKQSTVIIPFLYICLLLYFKSFKTGLTYFFSLLLFEFFFLGREIFEPDNFYYFYNLKLPSLHPFSERGFFLELCILIFPILFFTTYIFFKNIQNLNRNPKALRDHSLKHRDTYSSYIFTVTIVFIGLIGRFKHGAIINSLLYPYCLLCALLIYLYSMKFSEKPESDTQNIKLSYGYFIILFQFSLLVYNPFKLIDKFNSMKVDSYAYKTSFCNISGNILFEDFSFQTKLLCNKNPYFSNYTAIDLMVNQEFFLPLYNDYKESLEKGVFDRIITSNFKFDKNSKLIYKKALENYSRKSTQRNLSFLQIMELKIIQSKFYEQIPNKDLTEDENIFQNIHNKYYTKIKIYRKRNSN